MSQSQKSIDLSPYVPKTRTVNGQALDNDIEIKSVESADKLKTARTIDSSMAVTSVPTTFDGSSNVSIKIASVKEAYLDWGGKHRDVSPSPLDCAMLPELSTNRLAFIPDESVKFERSQDAGETWVDVSKDYNGTALCTAFMPFDNGNSVGNQSINRQHRITIECINSGLYCNLAKIIFQISTEGASGSKCKVEFGDNSENTKWTEITTTNVNGWSGWNVINIGHLLIGVERGYRYVRLTFSISGLNPEYDCSLIVSRLRFISSSFYGWTSSVMSRTGRLYSIDDKQNATFPKNLSIEGDTLKIGSTTITETQLKALLALLT